jgi:CRISPR-associated endoribonuclease Cas6
MRLNLTTNPSKSNIPYDYSQLLLGVLHKWLGKNLVHNKTSLYSFSWLQGAETTTQGFKFLHGAAWFVSMYEHELLEQCLEGIKTDPVMFHGLQVQEVKIQQTPQFSNKQTFKLASPVLIKYWDGESLRHLTWKDGELANQVMTKTLATKLEKAGIQARATISFDLTYHNPKTKLVAIHKIKNRASLCPVVIQGDPQAIQFAWEVGIGHSTGSGFGALV